jgi:hypothetical protein
MRADPSLPAVGISGAGSNFSGVGGLIGVNRMQSSHGFAPTSLGMKL